MTFAKPTYLLFLLFIPLFGIFLFSVNKSQAKALKRLGESNLIKKLTENINWGGRKWRTALWFVSVLLLIFSLARPQWGSEVREIEQEGLQVMVALDVSQSMLAQDIKPDRLTRAKLEIADLMQRLNGDEIGLVLFSGASFIQVPLTSDYNTALTYLDSAKPGVISRPGTVIGDAIRTSMQGFDPDLSSQKVLVVMTDGEDHETNPLATAQEIADQDVLIYTIGFGTPEGEPVPVTDTNGNIVDWKRDQAGNVIVSMLDEETLKSMAEVWDAVRGTPAAARHLKEEGCGRVIMGSEGRPPDLLANAMRGYEARLFEFFEEAISREPLVLFPTVSSASNRRGTSVDKP